ncbi:MAG: hypothetical protein CM1200mP24_10110 [Gammaproteobacteria bacterium]|nr:MAG: hypothetical protein CM1200mP24_10110 [Gammaproteobacteria bacterium]
MDQSDSIAHAAIAIHSPKTPRESTKRWIETLKYLGPSVIISATIVGSGKYINR